ncbi:hypothetical protein C2S53_007334 [Perilla frutescens var. hirtella]|uniref:BHLH domain-containing protein n=1 Tax=Perilla frutescens var. hirtella TaxID=608512 RepID=A0AAD4IN16_PERFH|nr:hypothetical protein C2S53_007334 [Perilla frutescens var. hirtella]
MESAANSHHHHHQLQDQLVGSSASSLATTPSCYGLAFSTTHAWPPTNSFLNSNYLSSYPSETKQQENTTVCSQTYSSSMAPDLGFNWSNNNNATNNDDCDQHLQHQSRIKEELANHYYRNYSEILSSSPQSTTDELNEQAHHDLQAASNDVATTKFLLKSFSYGNLMNKIQLSPAPNDFYSNTRGFGQIFPGLNQTAVTNPASLDMNLEALDLLASSRFSGNFVTSPSQNQIGIFRDGLISNYGFDHMQQSHQNINPFYASNKVSSASSNAVVEAKRNSNKMEPKSPIQNAPKKSRLEARSSCPPFKVRKEKLGDRIAALQQLVAPFGKTDTASVLMEAIGYIKFLQSQVETLSVPYMKASRNKPNRVTKGGLAENENEEQKRDLKSRGLCLVPLSCLSYITDGGGAAVWPPPHFGGAT